MYKVLLVDDEAIIVQGLSRVIPWERYDCRVAGDASDGFSGAKLAAELKPDILFTDIRMPGQDGLTMLAGLKSEHPDMQVTVLTGFRDFSYAQEAIRLGVTRFLLKPSKMDELEEALDAMTKNLKRLGREPETTQTAAGTGESEGALSQAENANSFIVRKAVAFIEEHCAEKLTLGDVADGCFVSPWHLSKLLSRYADRSFYDILNSARVERAKELMKDPSLRLSEISELLGYADMAHFSRVFKKLEGVSANEYRNTKMK